MKYLVLARRYRPQFFRDVIGQEAVLKTLKNALAYKKSAHAYLFCGSRGIGKTTLARLFAKALNCQAPAPDFEPCNLCPSCTEILSGQSFDVIEIDGASNRGIDDIRTINETVGYAPSQGKYKIYIIDEVHMLTKEAFNALLKTLEEPPESAKFFFATTEPHKVLPTILSRCQRFDLQRLSEEQIASKLQAIAADLAREAAPEALHRIAQFAEGSLRDAESLFDQILCFADGAVGLEHVESVLGLVPEAYFQSFDLAFSEGRIAYAFELVEKLFQMGKDLTHFLEQLIGYYRRLALFRLSPRMQSGTESLSEAAKLYTQAQLCFILDTLLASYTEMSKSPMQRVSLEALLLKILRSKQRIPLEALARRMSELEEKLLEAPKNPPAAPHVPEPAKEPIFCRAEESLLNPDAAKDCKTDPDERAASAPCIAPATQVEAQLCTEEMAVEAKGLDEAKESGRGLEPAPFNPYAAKTNEEGKIHPASQPLEPEKKRQKVSPAPEKPQREPMHRETLLRFAAVELEGTLQMEK